MISGAAVSILSCAALSGYLGVESFQHNRRLARIPLRIAVTGTRGKSTLVRLLAAIFNENGLRTAAKTTGTAPVFLAPDGTQKVLKRRGGPSIIEQKQVVRMAARQQAEVLICEQMSIQSEMQRAEAGMLLKPHAVVVTNARADHWQYQGDPQAVARVLAESVVPGCRVFLGPGLNAVAFQNRAAESIIDFELDENDASPIDALKTLAWKVAAFYSVSEMAIRQGIEKACIASEKPELWTFEKDGTEYWGLNAFAANDPESSMSLIRQCLNTLPSCQSVVALLNLRNDRGDRSWLWAQTLKSENPFSEIWVMGGQKHAFCRQVGAANVLRGDNITDLMQEIESRIRPGQLLAGLGNWQGIGEQMVMHWSGKGRRI